MQEDLYKIVANEKVNEINIRDDVHEINIDENLEKLKVNNINCIFANVIIENIDTNGSIRNTNKMSNNENQSKNEKYYINRK